MEISKRSCTPKYCSKNILIKYLESYSLWQKRFMCIEIPIFCFLWSSPSGDAGTHMTCLLCIAVLFCTPGSAWT